MVQRPSKTPRSIELQTEAEPVLRSQVAKPRDPRQPQLPFDPFPDRIEPCLALLANVPPVGPQWAYEVKWDGYRLAVHLNAADVRIITRGGLDWTHRFPSIARSAAGLNVASCILDGEAVVLDAQGRSDFNALQSALGGRGGKKIASSEVVFYAFDLLYFDGHDLTRMPLDERRHLLAGLVADQTAIRMSEEVVADGAAFLKVACEHGLEGIIAKRRDLPYRSGRKGDWLKIKCVQSENFVIVGYEPSTKVPGSIANLLLAARAGSGLAYVGAVGTGFSENAGRDLKRQLDSMKTTTPAVALKRKGIVFSRPELIAAVHFRGWTGDGKLRHSSFKGLRDAADDTTIYALEG